MKFPTPLLLPILLPVLLPSAALTSLVLATRTVAAEPAFSVMSWNLEWFFDDSKQDNFSTLAKEKSTPSRGQWNWKRDAVAGAIAEVKPSIVALQEIEGQRVLWYLTQALDREHSLKYDEYAIEGNDRFTEQDVGLLTTRPIDVLSTMRGNVTAAMQQTGECGAVSKHLAAIMEIPVNGSIETILIVNSHFRSGEAGASLRAKQATSLNRWLAAWEKPPVHLVVLGDFNTEQTAGDVESGSELAILLSRSTADPADDLIDLHERIPAAERQTHLLAGKQFDRILVSRSLVEDEPGRADLCFKNASVRRDLCIRGGADTPDEHWEHYWEIPDERRDLSDHYPVVAEFEIR